MASTQGPLALTLVFVAVTMWRTAVLAEPWTALRWLPVSSLVNLPLPTAVWVYVALLLGLNRLGRRSLSLTAFPEELPGLGDQTPVVAVDTPHLPEQHQILQAVAHQGGDGRGRSGQGPA